MTEEQLQKYWGRVHDLRNLQCEQIRNIGLRKRELEQAERDLTKLMRAYRATDLELGKVLEQMQLEGMLDSD